MQDLNNPVTEEPTTMAMPEVVKEKSNGNLKVFAVVISIVIVSICLFVVGIASGLIKVKDDLPGQEDDDIVSQTPILTVLPTEPVTNTTTITPTITNITATLPEYKMSLVYPSTWGFIKNEQTVPSYSVAYEFHTVADDKLQFTIDIVDGGILENYCSGKGTSLTFTDIIIAGKTEKLGKCLKNGVFYQSYSTINNLRFSLSADKDFALEALDILKSIQYIQPDTFTN
jgi:hypothetical protein